MHLKVMYSVKQIIYLFIKFDLENYAQRQFCGPFFKEISTNPKV